MLVTWPGNPEMEGGHWLLTRVMSAFERKYTHAEQNLHASVPMIHAVLVDLARRTPKPLAFKGHSMGCYLWLQVLERVAMVWERSRVRAQLAHVVLDAPDAPPLFFRRVVAQLAGAGVRVLHFYNARDEAIDMSGQRRGFEKPYPGSAPILTRLPNVEVVDCSSAHSTSHGVRSTNHDYGRVDGYCVMDQRDFLQNVPPSERLLTYRESDSCWVIQTGR